MSNADNAPAWGTIGGVTAGAVIGSFSGSAGTGALIGGMVGRSGGLIARNEHSPSRAANDAYLLHDLPAILRSAARFDASLVKEYQSLSQRRATAPEQQAVSVTALAAGRLPEIKSWIETLATCDDTLARAIRYATAYPTSQLGTWLNQRNQVRARLASLRTHQTWYQLLAS